MAVVAAMFVEGNRGNAPRFPAPAGSPGTRLPFLPLTQAFALERKAKGEMGVGRARFEQQLPVARGLVTISEDGTPGASVGGLCLVEGQNLRR
jgi:hypothetical protein